jgi:hypothetical protein
LSATRRSPSRRRRRARRSTEEGPSSNGSEAGPARTDTRSRIAKGFGALAAVVGVLVGLTTVTDWFERKLDEPEPRPPAKIDARIDDVSLTGTRESLESYLRSTGQSLRGLTERELGEPGLLFAVRVSLTGSVGERFPLRWSLRQAETGEALPAPTYDQIGVVFTPRGREHSRRWPIWVPYPPRAGSYFLRVTLTDRKRQPVDERDSRRFRAPAGAAA